MSSRFRMIPLDRIRSCPNNPRFEAVELTALAASIRAVGILEPLLVAYDPSDADYVTVVAGSRRLGAARIAGLREAPCVVQPKMTERTERTISLAENLHRRDLTCVEKGEAFHALMETGLTQAQVAERTGCSTSTVSMCVSVARKLIPEARLAAHEGRLHLIEAVKLSRHPHDLQRRLFLAPRAGGGRGGPRQRKTRAQVALEEALAAFKAGEEDLALDRAVRAVELLNERKRSGRANLRVVDSDRAS